MTDSREHHPYGVFLPKRPRAMIVGSFPIGKFSDPKRRHEIKAHELDFFFGGERNLLWKLLGQCYGAPVSTREEVKALLERKGIAIGDVIRSCRRKEGGGSDSQLYDIEWNVELLNVIRKNKIKCVYFTSRQVQKWFHRLFPDSKLEEVLLISPSAQSVRSVTRMPTYLAWKKRNKDRPIMDFILDSYRKVFV